LIYFIDASTLQILLCFVLAAFEKDGPLTAEEMEQRAIAKSKMLGNIKFIGTLLISSSVGY